MAVLAQAELVENFYKITNLESSLDTPHNQSFKRALLGTKKIHLSLDAVCALRELLMGFALQE